MIESFQDSTAGNGFALRPVCLRMTPEPLENHPARFGWEKEWIFIGYPRLRNHPARLRKLTARLRKATA